MPLRSPASAVARHMAVVAVLFAAVPSAYDAGAESTPPAAADADGLVISEVMTGGASANDEFIELYNPTAASIDLAGLEVVYVTATGSSISLRATWAAGAPAVAPGAHVLIAHSAGIHAASADVTYASGMAATGGSVALRTTGASTALDAVGWGTASSSWLEKAAAPAPAGGESLERLPGGELGSGQDTDDNTVDFAIRASPDPQNSLAPPITPPLPSPTATQSPTDTPMLTAPPSPTDTPMPSPPPSQTLSQSPSPTPAPIPASVGEVRALPDGSLATVLAVALTNSNFAEGGGYVADAGGGMAVLVTNGSFERGQLVTATGVVDDRFHQRTLRVDTQPIVTTGGVEPSALASSTGSIGEVHEGRLVRITGRIVGAPDVLSGGLAFSVDDGTGEARVIVGAATGIETTAWTPGATLQLFGVVGQRDTTGGDSGYRVQPRDPADVVALTPPFPSSSPTAAPSSSASPRASTTPESDPISIAEARALETGAAVRVRGVVTLASSHVEEGSAVIQDASGAIVLRLGEDMPPLARGQLVDVTGTRSTLGGMLTIRVGPRPVHQGSAPEPTPAAVTTGGVSEQHEARLVMTSGVLTANPRRSASGSMSLSIDDGSGELRVLVTPRAGGEAVTRGLRDGTRMDVRGVLGQETTAAQPTSGYRLWLRDRADLTGGAEAAATQEDSETAAGAHAATSSNSRGGRSPAVSEIDDSLATVIDGGQARLEVTLVAGPWAELGLSGVLWDGRRAAGIGGDHASRAVVDAILAGRAPPLAVRLSVSGQGGTHVQTGLPLVNVVPGSVGQRSGSPPAAPASAAPGEGPPLWAALIGRLAVDTDGIRLINGGGAVRVELACRELRLPSPGAMLELRGVATAPPTRLIVGCHAVRPAPRLTMVSVGGETVAWVPPDIPASPPAEPPRPEDRTPLVLAALAAAMAVGTGALVLRRAHARRQPAPVDIAADPLDELVANPPDGTVARPLSLLPPDEGRR